MPRSEPGQSPTVSEVSSLPKRDGPDQSLPDAPGRAQRYGLVLVPDFSLLALAAVADPLRLANSVLGRRAYEYVTLGIEAEPIRSSDGICVQPDGVIAQCSDLDALFVIGPNPIPRHGLGELLNWLRLQAARGTTLVGVDTGSYFLARAGLLDGYRCTIHWEDRDTLLERFPRVLVSNRLVEIDRNRYTCSGGVSPIDLMTLMLSRPPGNRELAQLVSDLLLAQQRNPHEHQTVPLRHRLGHVPKTLLDALQLMESNVEEPLRPGEIASYLGVSRRTLERLFHARLGMSPAQKCLLIRLEHARLAITRGNRSLCDIADSVGFASQSHFTECYRKTFGITPAAERASRAVH